jgi:hypothetical protein
MNRGRRAVLAGLVLQCLVSAAVWARADADSPTTISSEDHALSRSASAVSLSPAMPSGPPALSSAGAPDVPPSAAASVAPAFVAGAAPNPALNSAPPVVPPAAAPVVPPTAARVVDRGGARSAIAPQMTQPQRPEPAPTPQAAASVPPTAGGAVPDREARNRRLWQAALAFGGAAAVLVLLSRIR